MHKTSFHVKQFGILLKQTAVSCILDLLWIHVCSVVKRINFIDENERDCFNIVSTSLYFQNNPLFHIFIITSKNSLMIRMPHPY